MEYKPCPDEILCKQVNICLGLCRREGLHAGVTGTRHGRTKVQAEVFGKLLKRYDPATLHHGDCVGADAEIHDFVRLELPKCFIHGHPCILTDLRAYKVCDALSPEKGAIARNKDIVASSEVLFATPQTEHEVRRSGTWATIRAARRLKLPTFIVTPSGKVLQENT